MQSDAPQEPLTSSELKEVLLLLRQALLMIVGYIERKYGLERRTR